MQESGDFHAPAMRMAGFQCKRVASTDIVGSPCKPHYSRRKLRVLLKIPVLHARDMKMSRFLPRAAKFYDFPLGIVNHESADMSAGP